jgi:hypothetical protein
LNGLKIKGLQFLGREYRAKQRKLIKAGKIQDAFDMLKDGKTK